MEENIPAENIPVENVPAEEIKVQSIEPQPVPHKKELLEVVTVRDFKEYLGEALLIVFSVLLALGVTELINSWHEKQEAKEILHQLREEIIHNKESEEIQYAYHLQVLENIDSALHNDAFAAKIIDSNNFHLDLIAPEGVMRRDLDDIMWQAAKQKNIFSHITLKDYTLLTQIYDYQRRITGAEDKIGAVLLSWESRRPENRRATLILMRDNYKGWAVDRAPGLISLYQKAIDVLKDY